MCTCTASSAIHTFDSSSARTSARGNSVSYTFSMHNPKLKFLSLLALSLLALSACARATPPTITPSPETTPAPSPELASAPRVGNAAQINRGAQLYSQNCAACHGPQGEGAPDWENPNAAGMQRSPPLNGTGHTWHHPVPVLREVIKEGTLQRQGAMPPFGSVLTDQEIDDIIVWFLQLWPEPTYQGWYRKWEHKGLPASGKIADS